MRTYLSARRKIFHNKSFNYCLIMNFLDAVVVGVAYVSLSWHILRFNNSVEAIIIFMMTWWTIGSCLSPVAGYLIDFISKRLMLSFLNIFMVLLLAIFILFMDLNSLYSIYLFKMSLSDLPGLSIW